MQINARTFVKLSVLSLLILFALSNFFAQQQVEPSPTPSPEASPSVSPTPTPPPTPSPTPLPGAQNFHQWGSITVFNGLPSDSVRAIAQTPDGVMWFGTDNGLVRFDGRRVQNIPIGDADVDRILSLSVSPPGQLWIGTSSGAFVYSDNGLKQVENTEKSAITAIQFGSSYYYLGTEDGDVLSVYAVTDGSIRAIRARSVPELEDGQTTVTSLVEQNGILLAATSGHGVFSVNDNGLYVMSTPPSPGAVNALATGDGLLWLGTDAPKGLSGIFRSTRAGRFERIAAPTSKVVTLDLNDSGLWAGTERYGLFHFVDGKLKKSYTFENTSGGLRSNNIFTLFTDREGVLWIGTNRGVSRFDRLGAEQQTVSDVANSNFIRTLAIGDKLDGSKEDQIFAGSNRGLFFWDDKDHWSELPGLRNKVIYGLKFRGGSSIFVGTSDGLFDISGRKLADGDIRGFATYNAADYAAVYGRGVVEVTTGLARKVVVSEPTVTSVYPAFGKLWIGTAEKGLFSFDGQSVRSELGPDVLKSGTIWRMSHLSEQDGALYLAGQHGVFRVRDQRVEKLIDAEEVRDVFVGGEQIWAATTTRGLLQARLDERFGLLTSEVGFEQGLPSEKAFSIIPHGDGILVATNRGVVRYRRGSVPPKIIATRIASQRSHDLREAASTIALEYPQNSLLIDVAGQSSRTFPEEFQYAFVLTNSKGEEIDRRLSNDFQYSPAGLAAGDYTIEAIAFNRDLLASEPLLIRFSVATAPFPWTATALGVLLIIALLGLVWAFVANRRVLVRNRELAAAKLDLANEAERERRRIARDLHDQTLADLRSLMLLSDAAKPEIAGFRDEIEAISGEVRRICEDLSPSVLENVGLVAALEFLLKGAIANHSFAAKENLEENLGFSMNVQLQIYRIAQEVLTNIKNHSSADRVDMTVDESDGEFVMEIRDNGDAFDPGSVTSRGRGIANINARASMIGGEIDREAAGQSGNRFLLKVPK